MKTPWMNPVLRVFLQQDEHLAPYGFCTRIQKACYFRDDRIITVGDLRTSSKRIGTFPHIGIETMRHLQYLLGKYAMNLTLADLREANVKRENEWDPGAVQTLEFYGNELAGEVGEACNVIKKLARERLGLRGSRATVSQLAGELADILICVDLVAMRAGIDLTSAVRETFDATSTKYGLKTTLGG
jgi:NTP pyrophosphatase (non-canonical NTP hydrolase)